MDKNITKTVVLSNQRRFIFSCKYDEIRLKEYIVEARVLYRTIIDLPILPNLASDLDDELIRRSIFGTAAIEGNSLTEEQVEKLVDDKEVSLSTKQRAVKEILNLRKTYRLIDGMIFIAKGPLVSENDILLIHKTITDGIDYNENTPGKYRNQKVKVGDSAHGGIYTPPHIGTDIKLLMKELIGWLNSAKMTELNPILRAALAHYHFSIIHPFGDGNGRVARAFETYLLRLTKIKYVPLMLSNYYYKNIDEYYLSFSRTLKSKDFDVSDFIEFVLKGFIESLNEIKEKITYFIRKFTLRDYYFFLKEKATLNKRQFELLNILLNNDIEFKLIDLAVVTPFHLVYRSLSERTIKRDLQSLVNMKLITEISKKKFKLNMNILG